MTFLDLYVFTNEEAALQHKADQNHFDEKETLANDEDLYDLLNAEVIKKNGDLYTFNKDSRLNYLKSFAPIKNFYTRVFIHQNEKKLKCTPHQEEQSMYPLPYFLQYKEFPEYFMFAIIKQEATNMRNAYYPDDELFIISDLDEEDDFAIVCVDDF